MEALGSRVNMIEAERQQSEARVKEEVDASLGQKMGAIDQVGMDDMDVTLGQKKGRIDQVGSGMSVLVQCEIRSCYIMCGILCNNGRVWYRRT